MRIAITIFLISTSLYAASGFSRFWFSTEYFPATLSIKESGQIRRSDIRIKRLRARGVLCAAAVAGGSALNATYFFLKAFDPSPGYLDEIASGIVAFGSSALTLILLDRPDEVVLVLNKDSQALLFADSVSERTRNKFLRVLGAARVGFKSWPHTKYSVLSLQLKVSRSGIGERRYVIHDILAEFYDEDDKWRRVSLRKLETSKEFYPHDRSPFLSK